MRGKDVEIKEHNQNINDLSSELETKNILIVSLQNEIKQEKKLVMDLLSNINKKKEEEEKKEEIEQEQVLQFDPEYKSSKIVLTDNNKIATSPGGEYGYECYWILCGGIGVSFGVRVWRIKVLIFITIYIYYILHK